MYMTQRKFYNRLQTFNLRVSIAIITIAITPSSYDISR